MENFSPDELMGMYVKAGARYFVAQAMHRDNYGTYPTMAMIQNMPH